MRILNLFMHPLFPVGAGNQANTFQMCRELVRQGHEVGLVHLSYTDRPVRRKVPATPPFIEEVSIPSPLIQPLGFLKKVANRLWQATFGTPLSIPFVFSRSNRREVRRMLVEGGYEVLIVHYVFAGRRLEELVPPGVRTVLFTHSLWFQHYAKLPSFSLLPGKLRLRRIQRMEYAVFRKFDGILVVGDYEKEILVGDGFAADRVLLCGVAADVAEAFPDVPKRHDLLFVAGISEHNNDALAAFLDHAWPGILEKRLPITFACAGKICQLPRLQGVPGAKLLGFVDDLERMYAETRLVINPVRIGVGVKVKVVEAMARGCAVLTTSNGAEGIAAPRGKAILVSDDLSQWAGIIEEYMGDDAKLSALGREALRWSQENLSAEKVYAPLSAWLTRAPAGVPGGGRVLQPSVR